MGNRVTGTITPDGENTSYVKEPEGTVHSKFKNLGEVEREAIFGEGKEVVFNESVWNGSKKIIVPKWSMYEMEQLGGAIAMIVAELYPHDILFLAQIDTSRVATAASKIYDLIYNRVLPQVKEVVRVTFRMDEEMFSQFYRSLRPYDFIEIFVTIVEQEINNDVVLALQKKVLRLLGEKFHLENVSPISCDTMDAGLSMLQKS